MLLLGKSLDAISDEELDRFCKNSRYLQVKRYKSLENEIDPGFSIKLNEFLSEIDSNAIFYVLFRAMDLFFDNFYRYPGHYSAEIDEDIILFRKVINSLLNEWGINISLIPDDYVHEMYFFCLLKGQVWS